MTYIISSGITSDGILNDDDTMKVLDDCMAYNTTVNRNGALIVSSGGFALNTTLNTYGSLDIESSGTASCTLINSDGEMIVWFGGIAKNTFVNQGGELNVHSGGKALEIVENGGFVDVESGAEATFFPTIISGLVLPGWDSATIHSGTTANQTSLPGGIVEVYSKGIVNDTNVCTYGALYVTPGGIANNTVVDSLGKLIVLSGGTANSIAIANGGRIQISSDGILTGQMTFESMATVSAYKGAIVDFNLTEVKAGKAALVNDLSVIQGVPIYTLTVDGSEASGIYNLAEGAAAFNGTIAVVNKTGEELGSLSLNGSKQNIDGVDYMLNLDDELLSVTVEESSPPTPVLTGNTKSDIDGNGVSDVMFQWTGGDHQVGFWVNGTSEWQGQGRSRSGAWNMLGCHDMNADGKADMLMTGKATIVDMTGIYIGYYANAVDIDANWHTVGFLVNTNDWVNEVGNLTGNENNNSIVWYSPELYALGAWTDGTDNWTAISGSFGGDGWTLVGCGDFDGDGKDSVVMTFNNGQIFYTADLNGIIALMGSLNWSGWEVCAIGDFAGDGKDDMVLFHKASGSMVMLADGKVDNYTTVGLLNAKDWFVVGAGDYNGDRRDDLLVRQYSTGMLGYYSGGDTTQWNVLGYGVSMDWTVIA